MIMPLLMLLAILCTLVAALLFTYVRREQQRRHRRIAIEGVDTYRNAPVRIAEVVPCDCGAPVWDLCENNPRVIAEREATAELRATMERLALTNGRTVNEMRESYGLPPLPEPPPTRGPTRGLQ